MGSTCPVAAALAAPEREFAEFVNSFAKSIVAKSKMLAAKFQPAEDLLSAKERSSYLNFVRQRTSDHRSTN